LVFVATHDPTISVGYARRSQKGDGPAPKARPHAAVRNTSAAGRSNPVATKATEKVAQNQIRYFRFAAEVIAGRARAA